MIDLNFCADTIRMLLLGLVLAASTGEVMATLGQAPSVLTASSTSTLAAGARMLAATPTVRSSLYTLHEVQLSRAERPQWKLRFGEWPLWSSNPEYPLLVDGRCPG